METFEPVPKDLRHDRHRPDPLRNPAAVTAGYVTERAREDFFRHMDAANVDLKAFTERFYRDVTKSELAVVLETLEYLVHETDVWVEITNLLIPGENDSEAELEAMTQWVVDRLGPDVPMHFSAFHPDYRMLDKQRTPFETLAMARRIARGNGVRHAYTGNVHDVSRQSSYCHTCGERVIERDWYELGVWRLDAAGACTACGTRLPGVFDGPPGAWGRKRMPVSIG
jgi:pyruvate formate lyase activating enzyme